MSVSNVYNSEGAIPGSIYRIALENFVTYKQVELFPSRALNLIIGPNGTGKSTFVCAIILGLCGKTSVIGRAKKISEYVRSGCQEAVIEIELFQKENKRNVIIQRSFDLSDKTSWSIDGKEVREKSVLELITSLNIQVDNLCQLLPQDRVQDFSKMDAQQLLRSTLAAVGGRGSVSQLDELIQCRSSQQGLHSRLQNNAAMLQEQVRLNERLKVAIDAMQQRKEIEKQIEICEKKKLWLEYQELREKVIEYTTDKKEGEKVVASHRKRVEPLEKQIQDAKRNITRVEQQKASSHREILSLKDKASKTLRSVQTQQAIIAEAEERLQMGLERQRDRQKDLEAVRVKLDKLKLDRERLVERVGDETKVKMQLAELHKPISKTNATIDKIKKEKLEIQYDLQNNIIPQINMYKNKIRSLEDVSQKRLQNLRQYSQDAHSAVLWLRQHGELFRGTLCEPMMLEINFKDPKYSKYLESSVPARDLVAFTFTSSEDMNLFLSEVRKRGLKRVNAVCSQQTGDFRSGNINDLSYLGFYTFLLDTITAPEPIVRYLCDNYNIHNIPLGNQHSYKNSAQVPKKYHLFFTEKHRFSVRSSRYSGATSSNISEVRPARLLANTLQHDQLQAHHQQLSHFEETAKEHHLKLKQLDEQLATLETNLNQLNMERKKINEGVEKVRTISIQIRMEEKKLSAIENEPSFDINKEREKCRRIQRDATMKQCLLHQELFSAMKEAERKAVNGEMWKVKLEFSRNGIVQQESELRELKSELIKVQATLENIENFLARAKSNAKEKLLEAKRSCDNKMPQDAGFAFKQEFDLLPSDLQRLQEHCCDLQSRAECMDVGDEQIIREYEEREITINRLRSEESSSSDQKKILEKRMSDLKSKWLPPLEKLISDINRRFGEMFANMDCAGEIKLETGGDEESFEKYGICILVKFRSSGQLLALSRHTQSGGERGLATATYLLALQAAGHQAPFRCVDEINQGMDPVNERKLFQILVKVTTELSNSQYFLLTPKLLTNLEYNERIMIHTIMNGRHIMNYKQWDCEDFLKKAEQYVPSSHSDA